MFKSFLLQNTNPRFVFYYLSMMCSLFSTSLCRNSSLSGCFAFARLVKLISSRSWRLLLNMKLWGDEQSQYFKDSSTAADAETRKDSNLSLHKSIIKTDLSAKDLAWTFILQVVFQLPGAKTLLQAIILWEKEKKKIIAILTCKLLLLVKNVYQFPPRTHSPRRKGERECETLPEVTIRATCGSLSTKGQPPSIERSGKKIKK